MKIKFPSTPSARTVLFLWLVGWQPMGCESEIGTGVKEVKESLSPRFTGPLLFEECTEAAGLEFRHQVAVSGNWLPPEIMGSGCAVFDAEGDGDLDLYLTNSGRTRGDGAADRLFLRGDDGRYTAAQDSAVPAQTGYGMGVAAGDLDNDGDLDLYIGNWGRDALLWNRGDGTFEDGTMKAGLELEDWTVSVAFFDYDVDGLLDIYAVHYVKVDPSKKCSRRDGHPDYCGPTTYEGLSDALYRNRGGGVFEDVSERVGLKTEALNGLGVIVNDFNLDGWLDVFVANDGERNNLWINREGKDFVDEAIAMGVAFNAEGSVEASMGVALGDVNLDGTIDLFMTHLSGETNTLYLRATPYSFVDSTVAGGLHGPSLRHTGFGTAFFDFDNDGDEDLAVANGRVTVPVKPSGAPLDAQFHEFAEPNQLFLNDGSGRFSEVSARGGAYHEVLEVSRGLVVCDLDRDGDLDMLVTNCSGPARLYENVVGQKKNWIALQTLDERLNREVFGARVEVHAGGRVLRRTSGSTSSYLSSWVDALHFGLGEAEKIDRVEVVWPGGQREIFPGGAVNLRRTLVRGRGGG
jgi:hypothetical protein